MENNPINTAKRYEAYFFLLYTSIINKGILIKGFKISIYNRLLLNIL